MLCGYFEANLIFRNIRICITKYEESCDDNQENGKNDTKQASKM